MYLCRSLLDEDRLFAVQDYRSLLRGYQLVYSNPTYGGMSGGPILDPDARVIGIHGLVEGGYTDDGEGNIASIYRGRSLGVPVKKFLSLTTQLGIKREWLKVETDLPSAIVAINPDWLSKDARGSDIGSLPHLAIENPGWDIESTVSDRASTWLNRGNIYWRLKRSQESFAAFSKATTINPKSPDAWYGRGLVLSQVGKYDSALAALAALDQAISLKPQFPQAYRLKGQIFFSMRKLDKAFLNKALAAWDKVQEIQKNAGDKANDAQIHTLRSMAYYFLERYEEALVEINQALEADSFSICHCMRGDVRSDLRDFKGAIEDYTRAIDLNPEYASAYIGRGDAYYQLKNYKQAIADYTALLEGEPWLTSSFYGPNGGGKQGRAIVVAKRGNAYTAIKEFEKALKDFDEAIADNPKLADAYYDRGRIKVLAGNLKGAVPDLTQYINLEPNEPNAYRFRGLVLVELGDVKAGIADLTKASQIYLKQNNESEYQETIKMLKELQNTYK